MNIAGNRQVHGVSSADERARCPDYHQAGDARELGM